jgi:ribosomal protein S18 acetylase RimI-like enzyme
MNIRPFQNADEEAVIALWQRCELTRPWNDPRKDIARKLTSQAELFLVGEINEQIVASVMAGYDGHRGWVNYLAVAPEHRNQGLARQLMEYVEARLKERGCPKLNLQVRSTNQAVIQFYAKLGYKSDEVIALGKRLIEDEPGL